MSSSRGAAGALCQAVGEGDLPACRRLLAKHPHTIITTVHSLTDGTALHVAVRRNRTAILSLLLEFEGVDVNVRDPKGKTGIMLALSFGHFGAYEQLVAAGADIAPSTDDVKMQCLCAAASGNLHYVQMLIGSTATSSARDPIGGRALEVAARLNRTHVLRYLLSLQHCKQLLLKRELAAWRSVLRAVEGNHREAFEMLVAAGIDLSVTNKEGQNLVHVAALTGHANMLRRLLEFPVLCATLDSPDWNGCIPVLCAIKGGSIECVEIFRDLGADLTTCVPPRMGTALHLAAACDHADILRYLLGLRLFDDHINTSDQLGYTALMTAVRNGGVERCQLLLDANADPTIPNKVEDTVLHVACFFGYEQVLSFLLTIDSLRQTVNSKNNEGRTPFLVAIRQQDVICAQVLLAFGADPKTPDKAGESALHAAAQIGKSECLPFLLETTVMLLDLEDQTGQTPLAQAIKECRAENVQLLVDAGADLSRPDKHGKTPFHHAAMCLPLQPLEILLKAHRGDINAQDEWGETPLMLIASSRFTISDTDSWIPKTRLLLEYGALTHLTNKIGQTAKALARKNHSWAFITVLEEHEKLVAKVGQLTKPALRTAVELVEQSAEGPEDPVTVVLLDLSASEVGEHSAGGFDAQQACTAIVDTEVSGAREGQATVSPASTAPAFALAGLDEELAQLLAD
eukprot:m.503177 g.503177  ORF g.503177 m.503177 type:complete len:686 (+) comp57343_c0_seq4:69-2126(+)